MIVLGDFLVEFELFENLSSAAIDRAEELFLDVVLRNAEGIRKDCIQVVLKAGVLRSTLRAHETALANGEVMQLPCRIGPTAQQELGDIMMLHMSTMGRMRPSRKMAAPFVDSSGSR
jgi:hypothetical protein